MNSNKNVTKKQIQHDKKLIEFANEFYNTSTIETIEKMKSRFSKYSSKNSIEDTLFPIYFYPYQNGNLRITFQAAEVNHVLVRKRIVIGTDTKTGCKEKNECCLSYFDFIYIRNYLLKDIKFPMPLKPNTTDLIIDFTSSD